VLNINSLYRSIAVSLFLGLGIFSFKNVEAISWASMAHKGLNEAKKGAEAALRQAEETLGGIVRRGMTAFENSLKAKLAKITAAHFLQVAKGLIDLHAPPLVKKAVADAHTSAG
jgi:hypothetical protein